MKKSIRFIFLAIIFSFIAAFVPIRVKDSASAANVRRDVKLEFEIAENKKEDEFSVRVYLNKNEGICSLSMELSYDVESMMLASYTKGSTLDKLALETPEDDEPDGYAHTPFTFEYSLKKDEESGTLTMENDTSTGVLFLMRFKLREGVQDKIYKVTFINVEATYYEGSTSTIEKCATSTEEVKIQVAGGKVTSLEIDDKVEESNSKLWIVLISIIGGLLVLLVVVFLFAYFVKHKQIFKRKHRMKKTKKVTKQEKQDTSEDAEKLEKSKKEINYKELNRSTRVKKKARNSRIKKK